VKYCLKIAELQIKSIGFEEKKITAHFAYFRLKKLCKALELALLYIFFAKIMGFVTV